MAKLGSALRVAQELCEAAAGVLTPPETAAQHMRTLAIICQESLDGRSPAWADGPVRRVAHGGFWCQ